MDTFQVMLLAFVQGATEFLPISSSGHLVVARLFFDVPAEEAAAFDAFLHLGTLVAVLLYYWRVWAGIGRSLFAADEEGKGKRQLAAKLAVATAPVAVAGYLMREHVDVLANRPNLVALGLLGSALALYVGDLVMARVISRVGFRDAAHIGLLQVLALMPGISRSGITIAAGRWRGLSRKQATRFSFLLSAPVIAGAGLLSFRHLLTIGAFPVSHLVLGFSISFASGFLAIHWLLKLVEKRSFLPFVVYLVVLAFIVLYVS